MTFDFAQMLDGASVWWIVGLFAVVAIGFFINGRRK
jgi:hypothetical protein